MNLLAKDEVRNFKFYLILMFIYDILLRVSNKRMLRVTQIPIVGQRKIGSKLRYRSGYTPLVAFCSIGIILQRECCISFSH